MSSTISFYGGWAGIAVIAAGYWYLQKRRDSTRPSRATTQKQSTKSAETRKDGKSKKSGTDAGGSGADQGNESRDNATRKRRKRNNKKVETGEAKGTTSTADEVYNDVSPDEELDNKEFARQLQSAKSGTIKPTESQAGSRQKSIKQSRAGDTERSNTKLAHSFDTGSDNFSGPSSTTGVDGDDDLSATNSPQLGATSLKNLGRADVSDMLEAPTPGPAVLRITEPTITQPKKDKKPAQTFEAAETKKQRQNRKKAEAKKAAREEDEQERRVLMEKQRRTAREAEGRAAKDGSAFMASIAPRTSAWASPIANAQIQSGEATEKVEMLDTYDPATKPKVSQPNPSRQTDSNGDWHATLPSEEEQMRILKEDTEWNTVQGKKGKKKAVEPGVTSGTSTNGQSSKGKLLAEKFLSGTGEVDTSDNDKESDTMSGAAKRHEVVSTYRDDHGDDNEETTTLGDSEWQVA